MSSQSLFHLGYNEDRGLNQSLIHRQNRTNLLKVLKEACTSGERAPNQFLLHLGYNEVRGLNQSLIHLQNRTSPLKALKEACTLGETAQKELKEVCMSDVMAPKEACTSE